MTGANAGLPRRRLRRGRHWGRNAMADDTIPRRNFLLGAGTAVAAGLAPLAVRADATAADQPPAAPAPRAEPEPLLALTATEAAFLSAAADTMIPADELSPSGTECGVVTYIDRQLAGAYGAGAKMYRTGPFRRGKPEQGYQLALTPREYFATGIAAANEWTRKTYGKEFDRLAANERTAALSAMEHGTAELESFSARAFFGRLHAVVMEGFFSDPMYGGNRNKAGWAMLGFPGLPATYADQVDAYFNKRYVAPPKSIADFS
jgi:gluconate 2-dehydrogenase gamma chain